MTDCEIPSPKRPLIRRALLRWYHKNHRPMPWRAEPPNLPNPYHVLLSETMLQQTQVATVIDYFNRFTQKYPTITHLARADEQHILHLWQGLGYYRRARNLHAAAISIVNHHNATIPDNTDDLLTLPGIGPYCAGAIASIAFGQRAPLVDGNVIRVFTRLLAITSPIDQPATTRNLWTIADSLLPRGRTKTQRIALANNQLQPEDFPRAPGDFNQALMELGATVCTPRNPSCPACPLRNHCCAFSQQNPEAYPVKKNKTAIKPVLHRIVAIQKNNHFLFTQRPESGLWSAMWQMPTLEQDQTRHTSGGAVKVTTTGIKPFIRDQFNLHISTPRHALTFDHLTSHRKIRFELFIAQYQSGRLKPSTAHWRTHANLQNLPFPNPQRHALKHILEITSDKK